MSRSTIDVGIDLGTTNSAISRLQQGIPFVIPNNDGAPATPSVVRVNKSGTVFTGKKAYDYLVSDPDNTVGEFKRWIGTDHVVSFKDSGKRMTAPELSALILQSLRNDLQSQGDTVPAMVITVPAAFELNQCSATQDAAQLAGIEHAPLLQEPIAASLAYGYRLDLEGRHWLVYDLGGGTFDLALVGVRDGRVQVLDHDGDNHLGGKDFDWLLVEQILVPRLGERFNVQSFRRDNPDPGNRRNLAKLKSLAEEVKIRLSREDSAIAVIETLGKPMMDDSGEVIEVDVSVGRPEYEAIIEPLVADTVTVARRLLERNPAVDSEAVLLVGGPTLTPLIRQMLADGLGLRVDASANPLTVVAEGAALYAATQSMPEGIKTFTESPSTVKLELIYKSVTDHDSELVGFKLGESAATIEFAAADQSWSSGQISVAGGSGSTRLPLSARGPHEFHIVARGKDGTVIPTEPSEVTVTRGLTAVAAPLSRALGVVVEDGSGEQEVHWLIHKNAPLPALARYEFRTTVALEPGGETEIIQVHIVEGDGSSTRPQRQRWVGELTITDRHVPRAVPAGNPIEVRIEVDESRILSAEAYLPFIDQTFSASIEMGSDAAATDDLEQTIELERARLTGLAQHVPATTARELHESLRAADQDVRSTGGDPDMAQRALRVVQGLQIQIDTLEDAQRLPMAIAEAREESEITNEIVIQYGDEGHKARLRALVSDLDEAIATGTVSEVRRAEAKLTRLKWELLANQFEWWVSYFVYMKTNITEWTDAIRADTLLSEGQARTVREDLAGLRVVCLELRSLIRPEDERRMGAFQNVGIRR